MVNLAPFRDVWTLDAMAKKKNNNKGWEVAKLVAEEGGTEEEEMERCGEHTPSRSVFMDGDPRLRGKSGVWPLMKTKKIKRKPLN